MLSFRSTMFTNLQAQQHPPSFASGPALNRQLESLPKLRMEWKISTFDYPTGAPANQHGDHTTSVDLYHRDPIMAIQSLLDRPTLREHMDFIPRKVWTDEDQSTRVYNEIMTGEWAWRTQVSPPSLSADCLLTSVLQETLPIGGSLIPVLLGSDKTHLTNFAGDKQAWPLYLSIGNIKSDVRNKPTWRAWILLAYVPIIKFGHPKSAVRTALQARLFHKTLKMILKPLVSAGTVGVRLTDSFGQIRLSFPRVAAYLADLPEQNLINLNGMNHNPSMLAGYECLGDGRKHPPRTSKWILSTVQKICQAVDPNDIPAYIKVAAEYGMNGVHKPFWEDLPGYETELCLSPDILHGLHRFWRDHILNWVLELVASDEVDRRLRALQPVVGMRHFSKGIDSLTQWTGREDRELQRVLLATVAGSPKICPVTMSCLRAFHDFLYLAQYTSQDDTTVQYLANALNRFHVLKDIFIRNGARRGKKNLILHFNIPKLANLHLYANHIVQMGSSPQFSTEVTETYHQEMAKKAFEATNKKDYHVQMVQHVERSDSVSLMNELLSYVKDLAVDQAVYHDSAGQSKLFQQALRETVEQQRAQRKKMEKQPMIPGQVDRKGAVGTTWLATKAHSRVSSLTDVANSYGLPDLEEKLNIYARQQDTRPAEWGKVNVWHNFHVQIPSVQDGDKSAEARTVQAQPPSARLPYGCNDFVLIQEGDAESSGISGELLRSLFNRYIPTFILKVIELCKFALFSVSQVELHMP
jgi:hypothetical protein